MWSSLLAVGKWLVGAFTKVLLWTAAHPVAAITAGVLATAGGAWLRAQPWSGADLLGRAVGAFGITLLSGGIGAWIAVKLAGEVAGVVGAIAGGKWLPPVIVPYVGPWIAHY